MVNEVKLSLKKRLHGNLPWVTIHRLTNYKIHLTGPVNNNWNYRFDFGEASDFNKTIHLEIHQRYSSGGNYRYFVIHNAQEMHSKVHNKVMQFYNVMCWDTGPWDDPPKVYLSNVEITNFL